MTARAKYSAGISEEVIENRRRQPWGYRHPCNWKGGRMTDSMGYILRLRPDHPNANSRGYVQEAKLVMEEHLGRYLERGEVVHHINGVKIDNNIENLMLFASGSEHAIFHSFGKRVGKGSRPGNRQGKGEKE